MVVRMAANSMTRMKTVHQSDGERLSAGGVQADRALT